MEFGKLSPYVGGVYACANLRPGIYTPHVQEPGFDDVNGKIDIYAGLIAAKFLLQVAGTHSTLVSTLDGNLNLGAYNGKLLFITLSLLSTGGRELLRL